MATKDFHISTVLSVGTGILLTNFDKVHEMLDFMTQDSLYTHQLVASGYIMETEIKRQFPFIQELEIPELPPVQQACDEWVKPLGEMHGWTLTVQSAEHLWVGHDFLTDLQDIRNGKVGRGNV